MLQYEKLVDIISRGKTMNVQGVTVLRTTQYTVLNEFRWSRLTKF